MKEHNPNLPKIPNQQNYKILIIGGPVSGKANSLLNLTRYQSVFEEYNLNKKRKILFVFDGIIADILSNKKLNPIVTELFISGRKLKISLFYDTILFSCTKKS